MQAATVQALRQKFQEKERAKDEKIAAREGKAKEKEQRKRERREEGSRRASEHRERKRTKSNAPSEQSSIRTGHAAPAAVLPPVFLRGEAEAEDMTPRLYVDAKRKRAGEEGAGMVARGQWARFWLGVRTMWLKLRRRMGGKAAG